MTAKPAAGIARHPRKPIVLLAPHAWWLLKVCPEFGEEVYEMRVIPVPAIDSQRRPSRGGTA
jgi:hypothetical protein